MRAACRLRNRRHRNLWPLWDLKQVHVALSHWPGFHFRRKQVKRQVSGSRGWLSSLNPTAEQWTSVISVQTYGDRFLIVMEMFQSELDLCFLSQLNDAILYDIVKRTTLKTQLTLKGSTKRNVRRIVRLHHRNDYKEFDSSRFAEVLGVDKAKKQKKKKPGKGEEGSKLLNRALASMGNLRTIRLVGSDFKLESHVIGHISKLSFPFLETLSISNQSITDHDLASLTAGHPNLRLVNISSCHQLTDVGIKFLLLNCQFLQTLVADDLRIDGLHWNLLSSTCTALSLMGSTNCIGLSRLASSPARLVNLSIQLDISSSRVAGSFPLSPSRFGSLQRLCIEYSASAHGWNYSGIEDFHDLRSLTLSGSPHALTNEDIVYIATHCTRDLEELSLRYENKYFPCLDLQDSTVDVIAHSLTGLKKLEICSALQITDSCLHAIATNLTNLETLSLPMGGLRDGLASYLNFLPKVTTLNVRATHVGNATFHAFVCHANKRPDVQHVLYASVYLSRSMEFSSCFEEAANVTILFY